jgi:phage repressor protein C with HTH and peptisase S24 domain
MDMAEVRRRRLSEWFSRNAIPEKEKSYISQLINGHSSFGEKAARRLEKSYGMGDGYLDRPSDSNVVSFARDETESRKSLIEIPRMAIDGSMGHGAINYREDIVDKLSVSRRYLSENFNLTAPANLRLITGRGDSMAPTICDGDIILVDTGVNQIDIDAVFVLARGDELFIKRIQRRLDGSFLVISDNKSYDPYPLRAKDFESLTVCGRAVNVWNGRKL